MTKYEPLPADILDRIPAANAVLNECTDVVLAYLFGGLAREAPKPLSDVDIAVLLQPGADLAASKLHLFEALSDVLGTLELDLVVLNEAPISIIGRVLQDRHVLVDKDPFARHRYESLKLREFFDFKIMEDSIYRRRYAGG